VAKYNAAYKKDGILFMAISPGLVSTAEGKTCRCRTTETLSCCRTQVDHDLADTDEEYAGNQAMIAQFADYAPDFKGPITPQESVQQILKVIDNSSPNSGAGGSFVSHLGTKQWL